MKVLFEIMYVFFMCCNLISVIGFSVKIAILGVPSVAQNVFAVIALLTGMAFLWMLKKYINNNHTD